jgi:glucose-6-phosphate 1-dehydrogenase
MLDTTPTLDNPLRSGLRLEHAPEPCAMVIFGATGDLTSRKLVPALYNLQRERRLPAGFSVVGFARRDWSDDFFRQQLLEGINQNSRSGAAEPALWDSFAQGITYHRSDFTNPEGFHSLAERLRQIDQERGTAGNRVFYLATPPDSYDDIIRNLGVAGLARPTEGGWVRIIVEKPFGHDLTTAQALNQQLLSVFDERQVYRIDHYLGKETVQNILVFRFANGIFEPLWNRGYVDHVQITVSEQIGVEGRGGYYDHSGALRDMIQNHLMQLLSLVAIEPPASYDTDGVRDEKVKVLRSIRPITPQEAAQFSVRAQYGPGASGGEPVPGYRQEQGVNPDSQTETYVALKLFVENWRWAGVPFYLRSGKRLPKRVSEIAVQFRSAPLMIFQDAPTNDIEPNLLVMKIQPDEGITLRFSSKVPGQTTQIRPVSMDFRYGTTFGVDSPEAYERLLLDCLLGDSTLFTRRDEVEASWRLITPILEGWASGQPKIATYESGGWGPQEADDFIGRDGRSWRRL